MTVSLLLISLVTVGFGGFFLSMANTHNVNVPDEYLELYDEYNDLNEIVIETEETIGQGNINEDAQDIAIFKSAITAGKQVQNSAKMAITAISDVPKVLGVPPAMLSIIITIIIFIVSMTFLAYVLRSGRP